MIIKYPVFIYCIPLVLAGLMYVMWRNRLFIKLPANCDDAGDKKSKRRRAVIDLIPLCVLCVSIILLMIALSQPRKTLPDKRQTIRGISIMLALDLSGSMQAEDFKPKNRFEVARRTLREFIGVRKTDLIGMVVFGTDAYLMSPLTYDYSMIQRQLEALRIGQIDGQTAIGDALVKAINHIKQAPTETKVICLFTDGENNQGTTDPIDAAYLASAMGIKVYTIGMGKIGGAPVPYDDPFRGKQYYRNPDGSLFKTRLDEDTLIKIAGITQGRYFRATDADSLQQIMQTIDQLETSVIETRKTVEYEPRHQVVLWGGFVMLFIFVLMEYGVLRRIR